METIILFAPLVGALICGFGGRLIGEKAGQVITTALVFLAAALSWQIFLTFDGETQRIVIMRWIESGTMGSEWAIRLDRLTAIMLVVVNSVSAITTNCATEAISCGDLVRTAISMKKAIPAPVPSSAAAPITCSQRSRGS